MIIKGIDTYKFLIIGTLDKMVHTGFYRTLFLIETVTLFLSIKGKINFLRLSRYGNHCEQRYRQQFEKPFAFMDFNKELTLSHGSGHYVIAFDPSYVSKSGKKTPGVGLHWSGCAGKCKWGLEIAGIAAVDIDNHTAFHLEAVQTLQEKEGEDMTLTQWYADILEERQEELSGISPYLVCDAWFSKKPFVDRVSQMGMHIICRLRDDADLRYLIFEQPAGKRGRPRKYAGKIDVKNIDPSYFALIRDDDKETVHSAKVYSKALGRTILLLRVKYKSKNEPVKLYFTTDLDLEPELVLTYYRARFQIEFLYRDGKQHTGLEHCQARSVNKLNFHFNMSLTAINVAKVQDWLSIPKKERPPFSMSNIKTMNHNRLLLNQFFDVFGISPHSTKNQKRVKELLLYGTIAA